MKTPESLPPELKAALSRFQRRWRMIHTFTVLGLLLLIPLCSFGLLAISDRLWSTPDWARFVLAVPVPVLIVGCLAPWVRRWVLSRPGPRALAEVMGRLDRRVGDRLLGAVELSEGQANVAADSPALRRAAIEQVARELANVRAEEKIDTSLTRKLVFGSAALLLAGMIYALFVPDAARNTLTRWLRPHQPIERFTFVRFSDLPATLNVAHGEAWGFDGRVNHVRGAAVPDVDVRLSGPESLERELDQDHLRVLGEGLTQPRNVSLRAGDAQARVEVFPKLRPELVAMGARIVWPEYLEMEPEDLTMRRRRLEVPHGSEIQLRGTASRDLTEALAEEVGPAEIVGADFSLPPMRIDDNKTLTLNWVDTVGLTPRVPATVDVVARPDEAPRVALSGLAPAIAVLPDEFLNFEVSARDDYGLKRVWTRWRVSDEGDVTESARETQISGTAGREEIEFSPERFGFAPGQVIEIAALAVDAYPDREPSVSSRHRVMVISKEEHANMVMQQMDGLLTELDETIRQESQALEENRLMDELSDTDLADDAAREELINRALDELNRAERLMDTHRRMEGLISEATKNDEISDELIGDWTRISQDLQERAIPSMRDAAEALRTASEASGEVGEPGHDSEVADGDPADAGDMADAGEAGEPGDMADAGEAGEPGDMADAGEAGEPGDMADAGQPGDMADAGEPGEPGDMADAGQPGDMGDAGEMGDMAQAGEMGQPGEGMQQPPQEMSERREQLQEAMRLQEEAIAAMQQSEEDLNQSIEQSMSERFVNRLRALALRQGQIGAAMDQLIDYLGRDIDDLPEEIAENLMSSKELQDRIFQETRYVFSDLNGFYRRTQEELFREVALDMEDERFDPRLPELKGLIADNITAMAATEAREWSRLFTHWADMLIEEEDDAGDSGDGEGGDGAEEEGEDLETMIALIRARERQELLRRHTRALDESYPENLRYDRDAVELSDRQYEAATALQQLETRVRTDPVKELVSVASGEMMNAGVFLRRPQTDSETIATQTLVIELIGNALEQSMDSPPPSEEEQQDQQQQEQQQQQMQNQQLVQALMQMMQQMQMQAAGDEEGEGQTGFGDPGRADLTGAGMRNRDEGEPDGRAAAADPSRWPSSYRSLMDDYFQAIEE